MTANADNVGAPAPRPRRKIWLRRAGWIVACLCLAALAIEPLLLTLLPTLAEPYLNGRLTARDIEWTNSGLGVTLRDLALTDTAGKPLLIADRVLVRLALSPLRLYEVKVDSATLQIDLTDEAAAWRSLLKERPAADTAPARLPEIIGVRARLEVRDETRTYAVGAGADIFSDADNRHVWVYRAGLSDLAGGGYLSAEGHLDRATGSWTGLKIGGALYGDTMTLGLVARGDYSPQSGLVLQEAWAGDGIDTVTASGVCSFDSTALRLQARNFDFAARYPQIPWARGELLDLSLQGNRALVRVDGEYRDGRAHAVVHGEVEPEKRRARLRSAAGWLAATGNFTASGEAWHDTMTARWLGSGLNLSADRFPLALVAANISVHPDSRIFTIAAQRFRYDRYELERPEGTATWYDSTLTVLQLNAGGLGGKLSARGSINLAPARGDIVVSAKQLQLTAIDKMFRREFADACVLTGGAVSGEVGVHWGGAWKVTVGNMQLASAAARLPEIGQITNLAAAGDLTIDRRALAFNRLNCQWLGGTVAVRGDVSWSGRNALTLTVRDIDLAQVDNLMRAKLAEQQMRLLGGTMATTLAVTTDSYGWHAATTQPVELRAVRLWQQRVGTMEGLGCTLEGEAGPQAIAVKKAVGTMPAGEVRGRALLTGENYRTVTDGELTFTELHLADALVPLAQLCQPDFRLTEVNGTVDGTIRIFTGAAGTLRTAGEVTLKEVGLVMSEPNLTVDGLNGRVQLSPEEAGSPELRGYRREEFATGWNDLANIPAPNVTCRRFEFGSIGLRDVRLAVEAYWPQLVFSGAQWRMFDGSVRARGQISFAGPGRCGFVVLVNELSTRAVCAAFPGIENYLSGKANASIWLKSEELTLNELKGLATTWMFSADGEPMAVHRDLLIRLGGENLRNQLPEQRPYVSLSVGELTTRLEAGKMNFEVMQLDASTLFLTVKVGVGTDAQGVRHDRIGLLYFLRLIDVVSVRGVTVDVDF